MLYKSESIILKTIPYSESSLVVIAFSKDYGRLALMAKGVKKSKTSQKGHLQSFMHNTLSYSKKSGMGILTSAFNINHFPELVTDIDKLSLAYEALTITHSVIQENQANESLFELLLQTLLNFNNAPSQKAPAHLNNFKKNFMALEGILPSNQNIANIDKMIGNYIDTPIIKF